MLLPLMIVVTGASGLLGANLLRLLLEQGHRVRAVVHHDRRALLGLDVEQFEGDVCDPDSLCRAFTGASIVFHLAGSISLEMSSWTQVEAVNVLGTRHVVEACLKCGVRRLVHFSSIHALQQEPLDLPINEDNPRVDEKHPTPYSRSKALGEREVQLGQQKGLETVILNPTGVVAPYDYKPSYFGSAILGLARRRIPGLVHGGFDWVDGRDVAAGAIQAALHASPGANYILSGHWHSVSQIAKMVQDLTGKPAPWLVVPTWLAYLAAPGMSFFSRLFGIEPIYTRVSLEALNSNPLVSSARAARDLGYRARPFQQTLADTLEWFAANGYLAARS